METCASIFGGGGGWEMGAAECGLRPVWTIEHDPKIAETHKMNFPETQVIVADASVVDISTLAPVDVLFASPPCQAHSNARSKKLAPRADADVGLCVIEYLRVLRPRRFFLENVEGYKKSQTFKAIVSALHELGYFTDQQVLNAADYGVPQTRRRLILRASREGFPAPLPKKVKWVGWYEAIEDLIPTLPESKFADWQLRRLGSTEHSFLINGAGNTNKAEAYAGKGCRPITLPAHTVTTITEEGGSFPKAFIVDGKPNAHGTSLTQRESDAPMFTVVAQTGQRQAARAFIAGVQGEGGNLKRETDEPAPTITSAHEAAKYRAFIARSTDQLESVRIARDEDEPIWTLTNGNTAHGMPKAFVVEGSVGGNRPPTVRDEDQPIFTYTSNNGTNRHNPTRAQINGRVVAMTPRALARFQSIPDHVLLPTSNSLACKVIGNAMPPLLAQRLIEAEMCGVEVLPLTA